MRSAAILSKFLEYSEALTSSCIAHPAIIGLVLVGSAAETERVDEWSDHDFFVITEKGEQETLRADLSWIPNFEAIAFFFRETEHGLKVVYKSGAVLEFAVFDCDELATCVINHQHLAYSNDEVMRALARANSQINSPDRSDDLSDFRHFLSLLIIGVGRARRGEVLTAGAGIRSAGAELLVKLLTRHLPKDDRLDKLAVWRRFEFVFPEIGTHLIQALALQPEEVAIELLRIADTYLAPIWNEYPFDDVSTTKAALSWTP